MNNVLRNRLETYLRPDRCFIVKYIHCKTSSCYEGAIVRQTDIRPLQKQNLREMKCEFNRAMQVFCSVQ
jgi:hypothetical protein